MNHIFSGSWDFTVTADDGTSVTQGVTAPPGACGYGFYATSDQPITTLQISSSLDIYTGEFGISFSEPGLHEDSADMDCDGTVDFWDIDPFVMAVISRSTYEYYYGGWCRWLNGDLDLDGEVGFDDIPGFIACLVAGTCFE
jgi:hypothetical protein